MVTGAAMRMPALAVVGADHQIIRSTETFRRKCDNAVALCGRAPEVDLVLTGQADTAVAELGDLRVAIEAVTDAAGKRQVMLSLPGEDPVTDQDGPLATLRDAAAESAAIVWVKDLDGRYLYVNARFEEYLETSQERLLGNTDTDLPAAETVDGPRLRFIEEDGLEEPLQLEYTVPPYESRPAMAAFRFPLRNGKGQPIATCGVAAPNTESHLAADEAVRLMQLERWDRLDPVDVRAELLEQWRVQATPGPAPHTGADELTLPEPAACADAAATTDEPESPSAEVNRVELRLAPEPHELEATKPAPSPDAHEVDDSSYQREEEWVRQLRQSARISAADAIAETADALQSDLQLARKWAERADQLQGDLHEAHARLREAEAEAQQSRRYQTELEQAREELERERTELERERMEADAARSELEAARRELEAARRELGAAKAQAESLRGPSDSALRLSEELGRALASERERGDELARILARVRSRLGDLEGAIDRNKPPSARG